MAESYGNDDIERAYRALGLKRGDIVYVLSALWQARGYDGAVEDMPSAFYAALRRVIGDEGTVVVSTATMNLCNTDTPFDACSTPSFNAGVVSEFVRRLPGVRRSFHPFGSYAAVGPHADAITANASRHMFGPETPEARMIDMAARQVNICLPPNINSTVCHIEQIMGVPYRYAKEFIHPVVRDGKTVAEPFYLFVRRTDMDTKRNHCRRLFDCIGDKLPILSQTLGRGHLYTYSMADFHREATRAFADDIYIWCNEPPAQRPYRD